MNKKTNAMRLLEKAGIDYEAIEYTVDEDDLSGVAVAHKTGLSPSQVYKTLVAKGDKTGYIVAVIACDCEADLKKLAAASKNKRVELVPAKELVSLTGYMRGGCSPLAMKKPFPTYIDSAGEKLLFATVSAGVRGCQLKLDLKPLAKLIGAEFASIV